MTGISVRFFIRVGASDWLEFASLAGWAPLTIAGALLTLAVYGEETVHTNAFKSVPCAVVLADIANTVDAIESIDAVACGTVPGFRINAVWEALSTIPILAIWASITLSINYVKAGEALASSSVELGVLSADWSAAVELGIPLPGAAGIALTIDDVVAFHALASNSIENGVGSASCAFTLDEEVVRLAGASFRSAGVEHVIFGARNAVALKVIVASITEAVGSVPSTVGWAADSDALCSSYDSTVGADVVAGIVVEDGVANAVGADSPGDNEVVEPDVVDSGSIDGADLQHERVLESGSESDSIGGVEAEG